MSSSSIGFVSGSLAGSTPGNLVGLALPTALPFFTTWKSGYPDLIGPYSFFFWIEERANQGDECFVRETRTTLYVVDESLDQPALEDVTSIACEFTVAETETQSSPSAFVFRGLIRTNALGNCDLEMPAFVGPPRLSLKVPGANASSRIAVNGTTQLEGL
jgi:hypothetical protein